MNEKPFPCLDGHLYSRCVGPAVCPAYRCWTGRRLHPTRGRVKADAFDRPVQVRRYTASQCANCVHAVDLDVAGELRTVAGRRIERWTLCELDLWAGPASLYNLHNHRVPVKFVGRCKHLAERPPEQMRPELVRQRQADADRSRARRARLRAGSSSATLI